VRLSYTRTAPDVAGFLVYQSKAGHWVFLGQTLGTATTVDRLSPGGHYTFAVRALDKSGNRSALSSPAKATPYDHVAPSAVRSLHATRLVHRVRLSWGKSTASDHRSYRVQGRSSAHGPWRPRAVLYQAKSWTSGQLSCRHASWYRVRDMDRYGNAGRWRTVKVTPRCR
jgi:predicted phage tail protein